MNGNIRGRKKERKQTNKQQNRQTSIGTTNKRHKHKRAKTTKLLLKLKSVPTVSYEPLQFKVLANILLSAAGCQKTRSSCAATYVCPQFLRSDISLPTTQSKTRHYPNNPTCVKLYKVRFVCSWCVPMCVLCVLYSWTALPCNIKPSVFASPPCLVC